MYNIYTAVVASGQAREMCLLCPELIYSLSFADEHTLQTRMSSTPSFAVVGIHG